MSHQLLLGRDSWAEFPERTYRDVSADEEVVTFKSSHDAPLGREAGFSDWVDNAVSLVEEQSTSSLLWFGMQGSPVCCQLLFRG